MICWAAIWSWPGWTALNTMATVAAAGIVLKYTRETSRLRKAAEDQLEASISPMLLVSQRDRERPASLGTMDLHRLEGPSDAITVFNYGKGPALRVALTFSLPPFDSAFGPEEHLLPMPAGCSLGVRYALGAFLGASLTPTSRHLPEVEYVLTYESSAGRHYRTRSCRRDDVLLADTMEYTEIVPVTRWGELKRQVGAWVRKATAGDVIKWVERRRGREG